MSRNIPLDIWLVLFFHCSETVPWNVDKVVIFMAEIPPYSYTSGPSLTNSFQLRNLPRSLLQILCQRKKCVWGSRCKAVEMLYLSLIRIPSIILLIFAQMKMECENIKDLLWHMLASIQILERQLYSNALERAIIRITTNWYTPTISTTALQSFCALLLWCMVFQKKRMYLLDPFCILLWLKTRSINQCATKNENS